MIYQHPLAHLLVSEGLALLRAWAGDQDEEFVRARLAEVRRLLDEPALRDHAATWAVEFRSSRDRPGCTRSG